jgi:hypothetical protein
MTKVGLSLGLVVFIAVYTQCLYGLLLVMIQCYSLSSTLFRQVFTQLLEEVRKIFMNLLRLQRRVLERLKDLATSKPCGCPAGAGTVRWLEAGASAEEPLVGDGVSALVPLGGCGVAATVAGAHPG